MNAQAPSAHGRRRSQGRATPRAIGGGSERPGSSRNGVAKTASQYSAQADHNPRAFLISPVRRAHGAGTP
eukprot:CAMPEP_0206045288 /NCGR_PEP_ID=MMETSP1466-20131121/15501_1 /ASSEMBLY_ACC=CAM_ASM_001126 /TAXON_ID=44452 /ORGANISM="Pavlova gyrans, Strain CCMP608" /LENGTH=69 /DNA_ID=CAMNT_0053420221 /DNA_START=50 /DNA_END=257 /DNA_ORIENTATION=-